MKRWLQSVRRTEYARVLQEAYALTRPSSLGFVATILGAMGAILMALACAQGKRILGDVSLAGPLFIQLVAREFGPTMVGLMVAARYGASASAQAAAMKVTEQTDALELCGADLHAHLVWPGVAAGAFTIVPLAIWGSLVAIGTGGLVAHAMFDVPYDAYFQIGAVTQTDLVVGLAKCLCYGVTVPWVSVRAGLSARGGAQGVGVATTRAVIGASLSVLALDFGVGAAGHLVSA